MGGSIAHRLLLAVILAWLAPSALADYPAPLGNYVNDYALILDEDTERRIHALLAALEQETGVEMTVVVINAVASFDTGDAAIEPFATGLFNRWGIGDKNRNDGILLLAAIQDRAMRIELGSGYNQEADGVAQAIIDRKILPHFRKSDYPSGIWEGTEALESAARQQTLPLRTTIAEGNDEVEDLSESNTTQYCLPPRTGLEGRFCNVADSIRQFENWPAVGGGSVLLLLLYTGWRYYVRHKVRNCPKCGMAMQRLDDMTDDSFLDAGEKLEEHLESVDYDVWRCGACKTTVKLPYKAFFSSYSLCPKCGKRTLEQTKEQLRAATYSSSGLMRVSEDCRHCHHHHVYDESIPMLTRSDSSSSSSSFGGGRSSGGGASGRW